MTASCASIVDLLDHVRCFVLDRLRALARRVVGFHRLTLRCASELSGRTLLRAPIS